MGYFIFLTLLSLTATHCYGEEQQVLQMPSAAELQQGDDLQSQIRDLQKNVSEIWSYIFELRNAVSGHLTHLRQHQAELESSMHKMEHLHESDLQSMGHHHSGEHHSHSSEHSHGGSHSGEHHSHSGEHHSHSNEHHSHSNEHHSHSNEHHSHSGEHGHDSHSHSNHDHGMEDHGSHSHGDEQHRDSHETEDLTQQTQQQSQGAGPIVEPIVTATNRQEHYHRHSSGRNLDLMNENFHSHSHHHHHHDSASRTFENRTIEVPKYTDYALYELAMCDVTPNRAIPVDQQQDVAGTVTFWQKKTGGPLNFHVSLRGFNIDDHHGHHQQSVQQEQDNEAPAQPVQHKHGFHVHASGDLSNGCQSTGPHFNPKGVNHGGPNSLVRHVGDLGTIECDEHGITNIIRSDSVASLVGPYSIVGKSIVIHALEDDLGLGGNEESLKTGNAGTRIACCVIRKVDKIPIRQHKAMKLATQQKKTR